MAMLYKSHGFTLIELVVVLILISILAVGVYIAWPTTTINLGAEADQIADDLRYTQSLSMTKGARYRWTKVSSTTYQIQDSSGNPVLLALGSSTATLNSGITFGTFTNLPNNLIVFNGQGVPYTDTGSPGTTLASAATITVTASGQTKIISITPQTGQVSVQ